MAKAKKEIKPKYDPKYYYEDGFPKLPEFLDRRVKKQDDQHSTKTKKQKVK